MAKKLIILLVSIGLAGLTGCESMTKEDTGRIVGGVLGGAAGSQIGHGTGRTVAIVAGTLVGVYIGGAVGKSMDDTDRLKAQQTLERNPTNQTSSWRNPDTGNEYAVTPTSTYYQNEQPCREYTSEATIDGRRETIKGTACRQPDGTWKPVN
jgi:surface antigen